MTRLFSLKKNCRQILGFEISFEPLLSNEPLAEEEKQKGSETEESQLKKKIPPPKPRRTSLGQKPNVPMDTCRLISKYHDAQFSKGRRMG